MPQKLYSSASTGQLDHYAIHDLKLPARDLMQRAGCALFDAAQQRFADARSWLVLCGPGSNAGDGYVAARKALQADVSVHLLALRSPEDLPEAARHWADQFVAAGGVVHEYDSADTLPDADLIVDALLGTGLSEPLREPYLEVVRAINARLSPVISADVPTGLDADRGRVMGAAIAADLTTTFIAAKPGLFTADGPDHCGEIVLADLESGLREKAGLSPDVFGFAGSDLAGRLSPRALNSHKGDFGHVWIVGGGPGMSGAALLAGLGALRAGAGKVSIATHPDHADALLAWQPELMIHPVGDAETLEQLLGQADSVIAGPGLGTGDWGRAMFAVCAAQSAPLVLDADALNLLAQNRTRKLPTNSVLTPHPGEAGCLLGQSSGQIQQDRFAAAQSIADEFSLVVVLKGCGSVVTAPDEIPAVIDAGHPAMASGGMGDVLSGVMGAVLAGANHSDDMDTHQLAITATLWHAMAGQRAADQVGPAGILASEVANALPRVRQSVGA